MTNFELLRDNHIDVNRYTILKFNIGNYNIGTEVMMKTLIDMFNQEYTWSEMFNIDDVNKRIQQNNILFILLLDNKPIGYVWFKEINENNIFLYNLYVSKVIERSKYTPIWFVNGVVSEMLEHYSKITCECEEWNDSAQNVFLRNDFLRV